MLDLPSLLAWVVSFSTLWEHSSLLLCFLSKPSEEHFNKFLFSNLNYFTSMLYPQRLLANPSLGT